MNRIAIAVTLFTAIVCAISAPSAQAKLTPAQVEEAKQILAELQEAGQLYGQRDYRKAAEIVRAAQPRLQALTDGATKGTLNQLESLMGRLERAHGLLELQGYELEPLQFGDAKPITPVKPTQPTPTPDPPMATGVSFVSEVAPILNGRCGGCHVRKSSGKFSMVSYNVLMKGPAAGKVVSPGNPLGSRLLEVIEGLEMPPSGSGIPDAQYKTLTKWIEEGAKFDGANPDQNLANLSPKPVTSVFNDPDEPAPTTPAPTNGEVSFALHIAPLLIKNCSGCHVNANNVRGGLNMTTFANMMNGGDNGEIIKPGDGAGSLLVQKLKGMGGGQQMPVGSPPLTAANIEKFEKWINAGAKFDGAQPTDTLAKVSAVARTTGSTPDQISAERQSQAMENWQLGLPGVKKNTAESANFFIMGNMGETSLADYGKLAETVAPKVAGVFNAPTDKPLIKGKMTFFVMQQRYDYSEFGSMVERRKPPAEWRGHWTYDIVDAYGAFVPPRADEYTVESLMAHQIGGVYIASIGKDTPRWFAEGAGRIAASRVTPEDSRVVKWNEELPKIKAGMTKPGDFLEGGLPPEQAEIVAYGFVDFLMKDQTKFNKLLAGLRKGEEFTKVFSDVYRGSPAQAAGFWMSRR